MFKIDVGQWGSGVAENAWLYAGGGMISSQIVTAESAH